MSSVPIYHRQSQEPRLWSILTRIVAMLMLIAFGVLVVAIFTPALQERREGIARREQLVLQLDKEKATQSRQMLELDLLKNDSTYLETIARDRLDLMKPGETIFRMEEAQTVSAVPAKRSK
jgi:cell division protein FtsB